MASIALRLYRRERGRYPESLGELVSKYLPSVPVDPFTNKPIQYRRTQRGFVV
ncbi:MAG: type II secretion system protein GspG [Armatimonadetes bacterium]|nr:type II secretion system protein GspG [Armatimonadota bacterium]